MKSQLAMSKKMYSLYLMRNSETWEKNGTDAVWKTAYFAADAFHNVVLEHTTIFTDKALVDILSPLLSIYRATVFS